MTLRSSTDFGVLLVGKVQLHTAGLAGEEGVFCDVDHFEVGTATSEELEESLVRGKAAGAQDGVALIEGDVDGELHFVESDVDAGHGKTLVGYGDDCQRSSCGIGLTHYRLGMGEVCGGY